MKNKHLILPILFIFSISAFSQAPKKLEYSYTYRYFGTRDGLAQTQVFTSFQDSYGYIWFSTFNGVSRFDGLNFYNFNHDDLHVTSRIKYFCQYESAVIMISSNNIVYVYPDMTSESFPFPDNYLMREREIAVVGNNVYLFNCFQNIQNVRIPYSLLKFDLKTKAYSKIEEDLPLLHTLSFEENVYAIPNYEIINQQITLYKLYNDRLKPVKNINMEKEDFYIELKQNKQNDCFAIIDKRTEFNNTRYFYQCFIENDSIRFDYLIPANKLHIRSIERLGENSYLVGAINPVGLPFYLDTEKRTTYPFPLDTHIINDIMVDRDSNIWFSTEDGIYQCSRFFFESYRLGLARNDNIWGVIRDSYDNILFSSYGYGLWKADAQRNLQRVKIPNNNPIDDGYMGNCKDSKGFIYQNTGRGLLVFDSKQGNSNRFNIFPKGVSLAVYHDPGTGNIYFGGDSLDLRRLNILNPDGKLSTYLFDKRHIISICRDGNRKLRIGTFRGEAWFDEENKIIVEDTTQRQYAGIISMSLDEKGILWKGTTQGIFAEDKQGNDRQISVGYALFVIQYKNRYVIWGINNTMYILDLEAYHEDSSINVRAFGYYDGFDILECGQNGASIDHEGYVWLAGGDKAIRFLPDKIMKAPFLQAQKPYLSAIYNANKNSEWSLLPTNPLIAVDNNENFFRFDVLQASVTAPDKLIFRYKLNGYNEQWSTSHEHSFIFQNLPYGKFILEVQSSFDNGENWSESEFSPTVIIGKPFFLTFYGLLLNTLAFLLIAAIIIYYTRKISLRKEEEMRKIDYLKFRAVQANFIPHFTGNVLNSISALISKDIDLSRKYISKFSDFSKQTLLNSNRLRQSIKEEIDYATLYLELEKLRFDEKLEFDVYISPEIDMQKLIPTMILQTFCENAIKHGIRPKVDGGKIKIQVYTEADYVVLTVEDNGIGRVQASLIKTEGTKVGLKIVQQQLDIFNKNISNNAYFKIVDLYDEENQASGTRFELYIPSLTFPNIIK